MPVLSKIALSILLSSCFKFLTKTIAYFVSAVKVSMMIPTARVFNANLSRLEMKFQTMPSVILTDRLEKNFKSLSQDGE